VTSQATKNVHRRAAKIRVALAFFALFMAMLVGQGAVLSRAVATSNRTLEVALHPSTHPEVHPRCTKSRAVVHAGHHSRHHVGPMLQADDDDDDDGPDVLPFDGVDALLLVAGAPRIAPPTVTLHDDYAAPEGARGTSREAPHDARGPPSRALSC
jgi:hypothetical protein